MKLENYFSSYYSSFVIQDFSGINQINSQLLLLQKNEGHSTAIDQIIARIIHIDHIVGANFIGLIHEIRILRQFKHRNILPIIDCKIFDCYFLTVVPFFDCGCLKTKLSNDFKFGLSENTIWFILKQLLQALDYLHNRLYLHRNIKCNQILLSSKGHQIVLSGFENAVALVEHGFVRNSVLDFDGKMQNNINWLSPEVLHQEEIGFTVKADVYMLGITISEMSNGIEPYFGLPPYKIMIEKHLDNKPVAVDKNTSNSTANVRISYPIIHPKNNLANTTTTLPKELTSREFSKDFHKFISDCLNFNPKERLTISELVEKYRKFLDHNGAKCHSISKDFKKLFEPIGLSIENRLPLFGKNSENGGLQENDNLLWNF